MILNSVYTLHDIKDVEAWCTTIAHKTRPGLPPHQHEDLVTYLIEATWQLSTTWQPKGRHRFSGYASTQIPLRVIDWHRSPIQGGRNPPPPTLSLDTITDTLRAEIPDDDD